MLRPAWSPQFDWRTTQKKRSSSFTPASLTNLRAWYKSDVGTTIATGVAQWNDQSGNGNHLTQPTGGLQPTLTAGQINGLPAIVFGGFGVHMDVSFAIVHPSTVFLVMKQNVWANGTFFCDGITSNTMVVRQMTATPNIEQFAGSSGGASTGLAVGTFGLVTSIFNGASSSLQVNGGTVGTGNPGTANPAGFAIGAQASGGQSSQIAVAEIIVMAAAATAGETASVRAYSQARYGVGA